ncbi:hypothetical protein JW930_04755 [Candidatus Woesearchaeota archaeon]|nr:hypothetical protein [Candidatus Woesearchaeota archaeon]
MTVIKQAYKIAVRDLRSCYSKHGILTGLDHFTDYWARDSMYACLGALELGEKKDLEHVKKNLVLLADKQSKNGQIPFRVGTRLIFLKMLGIKNNNSLGARYRQDKSLSKPTDPNPLFIIVAQKYIEKTQDRFFIKKYFKSITLAMQWSISLAGKDGLIQEAVYSTWADTMRKKGRVLYTNVLYYASLKAFVEICKGMKVKYKRYDVLSENVNTTLNKEFWFKEHYVDWVNTREYTNFASGGNLFAIVFGIADKTKAVAILDYTDTNSINSPVPSKAHFPAYRDSEISLLNRFLGMGNYHNRWHWLWVGCMNAVANQKISRKVKAKEILGDVARIIVRDKVCHEVHTEKGTPLNLGRRFRSEAPYAWTAGFFVYAYHQIIK